MRRLKNHDLGSKAGFHLVDFSGNPVRITVIELNRPPNRLSLCFMLASGVVPVTLTWLTENLIDRIRH